MNTQLQTIEWVWLDEIQSVTLPELARVCGISTDDVDELVEYGALQPLPSGRSDADLRRFSAGADAFNLRFESRDSIRDELDVLLNVCDQLLTGRFGLDASELFPQVSQK